MATPTPPTPPAAPPPQPPAQAPFLTMHTAIILLAATLIAIIVGALAFLAGHVVAAAVLAGLGAFGGSIPVLRNLIA
ncbi:MULTISPECIES: hypothetical protein [Streptacidiphilus]|uniref:SpdD protein n=1 Tax=Streptacidiphilus cavernicola TaxID=3342716 RepID=A0ABV6V190_9ACTN|nr:hypothetical protein [Streptacidiphilus jeojiense]